MRRYQLLAAVTGKYRDVVKQQIEQVEQAIQNLASKTTVSVTRDHTEVEVVCPRNHAVEAAILHATEMAPVKKDDFAIHLTLPAKPVIKLHNAIILLCQALTSLHRIPLEITGGIILPPTTVGWRLETGNKGSYDESDDDWDGDEAFFSGHEMKAVDIQELSGRFRGECLSIHDSSIYTY